MDALDAFVEIEKYAHLLLGRVAIEEGFLSYRNLLEGLEIQHRQPKNRLGSILVKLGHLTVDQLKEILQLQNRLRTKHPKQWPYIPDSVLKGMYHFAGQPLGNVKSQNFREAEAIRKEFAAKNRRKVLGKILVEDLQCLSSEELKKFQQQIQTANWQCPRCERIYCLFNCDAGEQIPCPICWEATIVPCHERERQGEEAKVDKPEEAQAAAEKRETDKPKEATAAAEKRETDESKEATAVAPPPKKRDFAPRASDEMMDLYASLQAMQPQPEATPQPVTPPASPPRVGNTVRRSKASLQSLDSTPPVETVGKFSPKAGIGETVKKRKATPQPPDSTLPDQTPPVGPVEKTDKKAAIGEAARSELQKLYQEIEAKVSQTPFKDVASKKTRSQLEALQSPKYEKDLRRWKWYIKIGSVVTAFMVLFLSLFFSSLTTSEVVKKAPAPRPEEELFHSHATARAVHLGKSPETRESYAFLVRMLRELYQIDKPSHKPFNAMLRQLHQEGAKHLDSPLAGDIYNLTARCYYYKIYLDRKDRIFESNPLWERDWKKVWRDKALSFFNKAKESYSRENARTALSYPVMPWMPENFIQRSDRKNSVDYQDVEEAQADIERWIKFVNIEH